MKANRFLLAAGILLAMAFTFSCSSDDDGNGGGSKSDCIEKELKIGANTLDDVAKACNAIRSEVLSQLSDNVGSCNKNDLSFDKSIGDIKSDCGVAEIPIINPSSSSNSNGGSDNFNPFDLPKQLYVDREPFNGNGEIVLIFEGQDEYDRYYSDTLPAGNIQNGQVALNLPNINSKYLKKLESDMCGFYLISGSNDYNYPCEINASYPKNLDASMPRRFETWLVGKGLCYGLSLRPEDKSGDTKFIYFSEAGKITGTTKYEKDVFTAIYNYNMNISKGWNIVWETRIGDGDGDDCDGCFDYKSLSTETFYYTSSKAIEGFEWKVNCGGGGDK
jgi:hypothetical protein